MEDRVLRKLFLGFIQIHILHHAKEEEIYGSQMIDELKRHGYDVSPGTIYPIFHTLEKEGLLKQELKVVSGKQRKCYTITKIGENTLLKAKDKIKELTGEI